MANAEYDFATGKVVDLDNRKAIILVGDSGEVEPLVTLLRKSRYRMLGLTSDSTAALELVRKHKTGVIFIDTDLSGVDVNEILTHLKRRFPDFNAILMSNHVSKEDIISVNGLGAVGYLTKPLQEEAIRRGMSRVIL